MMATCPICGKLTAIYWPQFWVYRRGETYYCSENCLVVDRTRDIRLMNQVARERLIRKGVENMGKHRLTLEQKKKAVEIANQGGNQLEYLKKCGAKNPSAAWVYIKKTLMDKAPEKLEGVQVRELIEKPILAEVAEKVPEAHMITKADKTEPATEADEKLLKKMFPEAVDMGAGADVSILSAACKGFIFTNIGGGILIEKPERGQSLTIEKEEINILIDALPKVAGIFKGGQ